MTPEELRETINEFRDNPKREPEPRPAVERLAINPQTIYSWKAPLRAYKRKPAGVLRFYAAIAFLLSLIVFFFGDKILILPIWATVFLVYVLTITPPPIVENKITKFGIETIGNAYKWDQLSHYYFVRKFDYHVLVIVSIPPQYSHIYLVITKDDVKEKVLHLLAEHLVYLEKPQRTATDKMIEWLSQLMPDYEEEPVETNQREAPPETASIPVEEFPLPQTPVPREEPPRQL